MLTPSTKNKSKSPCFLNTFYFLSYFLIPIFLLVSTLPSEAQGVKVFTVNVDGDEADPDAETLNDDGLCDVDPNTPGDQCTFRAAIQNHNANRAFGTNTIFFEVPVDPLGLRRVIIKVGSTGLGPLPPILGSVSITGINVIGVPGETQRVELDGSLAGTNAQGLLLRGGNSFISSFIIHSFSSHGIMISGTPPPGEGGHIITDNIIGLLVDGSTPKGNGGDGIFIEDTPGCMIGKSNLISANQGYGIRVLGLDPNQGQPQSGAPNTVIEGNTIGFNVSQQQVIPNVKGGILLENVRESRVGGNQADQKNVIGGVQNGISIIGLLARNLNISSNTIGKDGTGAKFVAGIFVRRGQLLTIQGNLITNIEGIGIDFFVDASSNYKIDENRMEGNMKVGSKFSFGAGVSIDISYKRNFHIGNETGMNVEESAGSTINWDIIGGNIKEGQVGGKFFFKASGNKNFQTNNWEGNSQLGLSYTAEIDQGVHTTLSLIGDIYRKNAQDGITGKVQAKGELSVTVAQIVAAENGQNGLRLDLFVGGGATMSYTQERNTFTLNGAAGARLVGDRTNVDILRVFVERDVYEKNTTVGVDLFNFRLPKSISNNIFTNNGGAAIQLAGASEAGIDHNIMTGNGTGILLQDESLATINNNTISGNKKGIVLAGSGTGIQITNNSIFNNVGLGLDLGNNDVTSNDPGDADTGPNGLQNFPVLTSASSSGGNTIIDGTLNSLPNSSYTLEFFSNEICNASGFGEGKTFLGSQKVNTDGTGNITFHATFSGVSVPQGALVTATATDASNNTSEFAACRQVGQILIETIAITEPANHSTFFVSQEVTVSAAITNPSGTISKVEFFASGVKIGEDATSPFSIKWIPLNPGNFELTAKATLTNKTLTSLPISVLIKIGGAVPVVESFTLVNALSDQDITGLKDGDVINVFMVAPIGKKLFNIRANVSGPVQSVRMILNGKNPKIENFAPYALYSDNNGDYNGVPLFEGVYTLEAIAFTGEAASGTAGPTKRISFTIINRLTPVIKSFTLVNALTDLDIETIEDGETINVVKTGPIGKKLFNIRADVEGSVGSVRMILNDRNPKVENIPPFALYGDTNGDYNGVPLPEGTYTLEATAFSSSNATRKALETKRITFTIINRPIVESFSLVNGLTNQIIGPLNNFVVLDFATLPAKINIRANTFPSTTGSVLLDLNAIARTDNSSPYTVSAASFTPVDGNYVLKATPFTAGFGGGNPGISLSIAFSVVNSPQALSNFVIMPNPVTTSDKITVKYSSAQEERINIRIYNLYGKEMYSKSHSVGGGENSFELDTQTLSPGMYKIQLMSSQENLYKNIMVNK